ncbi:unnamed protein product [Mytilus coruscus]|uniref:DDE Tnp4 domain-containing protein n=1 Tax=Mytilus coruscus TaxID=42192 RepID=A0A6J8A4W8_MYTCO|nr:unnamed protein product [Mytilus coruscus]
MYDELKVINPFPSREIIDCTMPEFFKSRYPKVILDCTEICLQRSASLINQSLTYSNYKNHNTVKFLIGITPSGVICFVSEGRGGRVSDRQITQESGILDLLDENDSVMADKGFTIKDYLEKNIVLKTGHPLKSVRYIFIGVESRYGKFTMTDDMHHAILAALNHNSKYGKDSSNFDGTAPLGWYLLKASIESTAFVNGWKSEQKLQTLASRISGKALKFYKNRSYTVQADYETLCKLFNDRFDSVGYPCLILENLENIFPYPDELLDEFTDRIKELVEGAFQNEPKHAKQHLVIKYLTNACGDEKGKELVKAVAEGSVYEAKRYICVLGKVNRNLKLQSLWEPKMKSKRDDINLKIEKTGDHDPIVRSKGTDEVDNLKEIFRTVHSNEPENYTPSKNFSVGEDYTTQTKESPKSEPDSLSETDEKEQIIPTIPQCSNTQKNGNRYWRKITISDACIQKYDKVKQIQAKHERGENKDTKNRIERNSYSKNEINRISCQNRSNDHALKLLSDIIDRLAPTSVYRSDKWLTCELKSRKYRYWIIPSLVDERNTGDVGVRERQIAVQ